MLLVKSRSQRKLHRIPNKNKKGGFVQLNQRKAVCLPPTPKKKALLIEDDVLIQYLHHRYLHELDFTVDIAETQVNALSFAFNHTYDLILADLGLADSREESIITNLRCNDFSRNRKTPLIVVTASHSECLKKRCLMAGANAFIVKPLTKSLLKATLDPLFSTSTGNHLKICLSSEEH